MWNRGNRARRSHADGGAVECMWVRWDAGSENGGEGRGRDLEESMSRGG